MRTRRSAPRIDIVAFDRDDRPVLIVEVKSDDALREVGLARLRRRIRRIKEADCLAMLATAQTIEFFERDGADLRPILSMPAEPIFAGYDAKYAERRDVSMGSIRQGYLKALAGGWIHDFQIHWEHEYPPGLEALRTTGLPERLADGFIAYEVPFDDNLIR